MKKKSVPKIEVGQCYSYHDVVYMIVQPLNGKGWWVLQDTLTKEEYVAPDFDILTWRRPFENYG